jgi:predicted DNA-binding transcriptional regulator AlpA
VNRVLDKLSRQKSWLYAKLQNDPSFPKPLRLDSRLCFIESEIDAWVAQQAQREPAV